MPPKSFLVRALGVGILCALISAAWDADAGTLAAKRHREPAVEIDLKLDHRETLVGSWVNLQELVPATMKAEVGNISHTVLRIGRYDVELRRLVNINHDSFSLVNPDKAFSKLPESLASSHPYSFDVRTPKVKGAEFRFRPNRLGIFLITATWLLRNQEAPISSNPAVLLVKPPVDAKGRPVVEPEWLAEEGWGRVLEKPLKIIE